MNEPRPAISPVRIAVVQFDPQAGVAHIPRNLDLSLALADQAVRGGADLIVLPELANTGYSFQNRQEAFAHAEAVPEGPCVQAWMNFAREHRIYLAAGIAECDGVQLFDTAVLVGPDGFIGKYRKAHLWNEEKLWFTPGNLGFPVFDTPIGRIGLLICWDIWFPEVPRLFEPARGRYHLQPEQLGLDPATAVRRNRQMHGLLPDHHRRPRQQCVVSPRPIASAVIAASASSVAR